MLVLSRKRKEEILIGDIRVVVVEILQDQVRIGIEAPPDVQVDRFEIRQEKIRRGEYKPG